MSAAREEILARIAKAKAGARALEYGSIPRHYRRAGELDGEARIALFIDRLHDYDAIVYRTAESAISRTIAEALGARGKRRLAIPASLPVAWLPPEFEFVRDDMAAGGLSYAELDASDGAITGCLAAVAFTGTIVLRHGKGEARRALTLIPDYHLCVVRAEQLVETLPEAIARVRDFRHSPLTTVSGPSATSDIEMTRIRGVHGPRTLDVVLVG
ncbi:MAG: LutC/YkgG family protein [Bryobacteraceae bacterium]